MSLFEVGALDRYVDPLRGGDVNPGGRLLSVAEIQQALRELRRHPPAAPHVATAPSGVRGTSGRRPAEGTPDTTGPAAGPQPDTTGRAAHSAPDTATGCPDTARPPAADDLPGGESGQRTGRPGGELPRDWVAVAAAHAGAGASTTALALADALSAEGRAVRLIETASPRRSGLAAATAAEMGSDPAGAWRLGSRHLVTLYRRTNDRVPDGWPAPGDSAAAPSPATVVDLGLPSPGDLLRLAAAGCRVVVVCRVTVPGSRLVEQLLAELDAVPAVVAAVGPARWPGEVTAGAGSRLRAARTAGRVVAVPEDRRLAVTGPTSHPLPKSVAVAGRALLALLDVAGPGGAPTSSAPSVPPAKGLTR